MSQMTRMPASASPEKVLIAEDEVVILEAYADIAAAAGFEAVPVADGRQALTVIEESSSLAILVTDENLPNAKGSDIALAFHKKFPHGRICILSGHLDLGVELETKLAGISFSLQSKPIKRSWLKDWLLGRSSLRA